jgi:DNA polymerase elongation subunit (family B)
MLIPSLKLDKILFLDIETAPQVYLPQELDDATRKLFGMKVSVSPDEIGAFEEAYFRRSSILAEFGKIICISVGFLHETNTGRQIRLKSFYHDDEETLLLQFKRLLDEHYNTPYHLLCGHNAKEFDFPYICRRMLIHGIQLPHVLNMAGKKPWEIAHLDTMELWKFGDYKAYTSLALLCHVFNIPTPKDDISGADVARVYYEEKNLERIKVYCEKDVVALMQLFLKMQGQSLVDEAEVYHSTE